MPEAYQERREKPWGHEVCVTPPGLERVGKLIFVKAGCKLSLQYHTEKEETICLYSGEALLWWQETADATLEKIPMQKEAGYTVRPGNIHRFEAITDSLFFEVSSPEKGTTVRLDDDYRRPDEVR